MTCSAIIFDFNGVLLWDAALQEESWRAFSAKMRGYALTREEMQAFMHGRSNRDVMTYILGHPPSADELPALIDEKESLYRRMCLENPRSFVLSPGAIPLLDSLAARSIPHTIATASEWGNVSFFIQHLELARWFDPSKIVYDDGQMPNKPAPDIYLRAARVLGLPPADCLVVEDSRSGLRAAHAAGIGQIAALGPRETHAELARLPGVSRVITRLDELIEQTPITPKANPHGQACES